MISFRICIAILFAAICLQQELGCTTAEELSYRLLDLNRRQFGDTKIANYAISIDRFLDLPQINQLICQMLRKEKPTNFSLLSIEILFGTNKPISGGLPSLEREWLEHIVATYSWSINLPNRPIRLVVWRDAQGNLLDPPQFYDFDHTKACKQDANPGNSETGRK